MLNVGPLELLVVLAVALIVVGPERLPDLARSVGRALRQLRQVQDEVRDMVTAGVDDEVRQAATEFKQAGRDIATSSGVGDLARKSGRAAGPRKTAPGRARQTPATRGTSGAALEPRGESTETETPPTEPATTTEPQVEARPAPMDAEVAGPPADRLVEDGSVPADAPPREAGDAGDRATER